MLGCENHGSRSLEPLPLELSSNSKERTFARHRAGSEWLERRLDRPPPRPVLGPPFPLRVEDFH